MGDLVKFAASMPDNVKVMTYCLDGEYAGDSVKEVLEENGFEGITIISGDGDIKIFDSEIMYTPTTVFVDSEGGVPRGRDQKRDVIILLCGSDPCIV